MFFVTKTAGAIRGKTKGHNANARGGGGRSLLKRGQGGSKSSFSLESSPTVGETGNGAFSKRDGVGAPPAAKGYRGSLDLREDRGLRAGD